MPRKTAMRRPSGGRVRRRRCRRLLPSELCVQVSLHTAQAFANAPHGTRFLPLPTGQRLAFRCSAPNRIEVGNQPGFRLTVGDYSPGRRGGSHRLPRARTGPRGANRPSATHPKKPSRYAPGASETCGVAPHLREPHQQTFRLPTSLLCSLARLARFSRDGRPGGSLPVFTVG